MSEDELNRIEELFRHPPSFGILPELGLKLAAEVRRNLGTPVLVPSPSLEVAPIAHADSPIEAHITPPASPKAKKGHK